MPIDRRQLLKTGAAAALGSATLGGCREGEDTGTAQGVGQIDHVIVVMMENRSFDHYLGALTLEEGRDEIDGLTGLETNPSNLGEDVPVFKLDISCQEDPPHSWGSSHAQYNQGANDGFVIKHEGNHGYEVGAEAMGYYGREALPIHYALADHYCVPDRFFCSVMSSTWPNRFYGHTGSSKGIQGNDTHPDGYDQMSVYKALEEVGEDWRYYYTDVPFIGLLEDHWDGERIGTVEEFLIAARNGSLPAFTWIDPGFTYNDDHPPHHVGLGQMFLATIYEALAQSPAWERTLLVITYDEHGGFFDHVPPPTTPDDYPEFIQMGFRIPALIVGPWVKQGVDPTVYDHASVLKYVCERFGIEPWNTRIAGVNSIAEALDQDRMAQNLPLDPVVLPAFSVPDAEVTEDCHYEGFLEGELPDRQITLPPKGARQGSGVTVSRKAFSTPGGQPELEAWVEQNMPWADRRQQVPEIHQRLLATARELGLIR